MGYMNTMPGRLDTYELQEQLGQSGLSEVWKAFDTQLHRYVAIKFLRVQLQADPHFAARFQREAQAIMSLRHPGIVQVYDFSLPQTQGSGAALPYVVTEYVDGGSLANYIQTTASKGAFPAAPDLVRLFTAIGMAVDYAHQHGVIHGQLKPANILLDKRNSSRNIMGEPRVADFGMLKLLGITAVSTSGWSIGAPLYTSPEQIMGSPANERSDIYSLGIILYELCAGTPPFTGNNPATIIMQHVNTMPTSPALINPHLPPALTAIIMRCIAKDPAARFPSVSSLVAALSEVFAENENATLLMPENTGFSDPSNNTSLPTVISAGKITPLVGMTPAALTPSSPGGAFPFMPTAPAMPGATGQGGVGQPYAVTAAGSQPMYLATPASVTPAQSGVGFPGSAPSPTPAPQFPKKRRGRGLLIALIALLVLVVLGSGLGAWYAFFARGSTSAAPSIAGHAYFFSSGLLSSNPESRQGITDQLQIHLEGIPAPQTGKSYYAWLLNDITLQSNALLLGQLTVKNGAVDFSFPGDALHSNLLATNSRFLITEENASTPPVNPSLDPATYSYYAEFSQKKPIPNNPTSYSLYDHIRHLLADDPKVKAAGLTGGLDIWLYRNTQKILEWAGSARDAWKYKDSGLIHRQLLRIIDYLDGGTYAQQDLPGQNVLGVLSNPTIAKIGLLTPYPQTQDPPGYLYHIGKHLREIALLPQTSAAQKALAEQINQAIDQVTVWFNAIRKDVLQLYAMSDAQLFASDGTGRSLLDTVATDANYAFVGQVNPQAQVLDGVVQIHYDIQRMATFDIRSCTASNPCSI